MSPLTQITEVLPTVPGGALAGFSLDAPTPGEAGTYALDLRGWVVGAASPVASVLVLRDGTLLRSLPAEIERPDVAALHPGLPEANRSGFFGTLGALSFEQRFELQIEVRLQDGTQLPVALVRGTRAPLQSSFEPRLQPLLLTTLGRTGSTAVVRMLAAHPEVVAYRPFEYEARVATYWMGVLQALSDPASYRRQLAPTGTIDGVWWLGEQTPLPRPIRDAALDPWLDAIAIGELAGVAQQRIERLYAEVARTQERPQARYFVEKYRPDVVSALMLELYPQAREVILVRDFRDMIASMFAYNEKRGRQGFSRDRATSDRDYILNDVGVKVAALADAWARRSDTAHLLRYEDLVLRPEETVQALVTHLGLDAGPGAVESMLGSLLARDSGSEGHRTVADPRETIGRWRSDLSDEAAAACAEALHRPLEAFGYDRA